jgi:hypothetical protein
LFSREVASVKSPGGFFYFVEGVEHVEYMLNPLNNSQFFRVGRLEFPPDLPTFAARKPFAVFFDHEILFYVLSFSFILLRMRPNRRTSVDTRRGRAHRLGEQLCHPSEPGRC